MKEEHNVLNADGTQIAVITRPDETDYISLTDVINVALFGMTARQWRDAHPDSKGNMRDEVTITELVVLGNLESM